MTDINDTQRVINAIPEGDTITIDRVKDTFTTKSGVMLKLKRVPPLLVDDARRNLVEPRVPKVPNLDKDEEGSVEEDNPSDPDYVEALSKYQSALSDLTSGIYLTRGTEPYLQSGPSEGQPSTNGIPNWESSEWSADIEDIAQIKIPAVGRRRYWCWLKYIVLDDINDFGDLLKAVMRMSGITMEEDVAKAADSFRSDEEGDTAQRALPAEGSGLGNTDQQLETVGSTGA